MNNSFKCNQHSPTSLPQPRFCMAYKMNVRSFTNTSPTQISRKKKWIPATKSAFKAVMGSPEPPSVSPLATLNSSCTCSFFSFLPHMVTF